MWSKKYQTIGLCTGDNVYYYAPDSETLHSKLSLVHWHGLNMSHMFKNKHIAVDPYSGGHVKTQDLASLIKFKKPCIVNCHFDEPIEGTNLESDTKILQNIILKQEKAIDELKQENEELKNKLMQFEQVHT